MTRGMFTLTDRDGVLEPEDLGTLHKALCRAAEPIWADRPWLIVDPAGRPAASPTRKETPA
ncbi:hypothetical protein KNU57_gp67 [Gordonia phage Valary]|uniref:Uncharacterized protein n=1 Tax=Gordonia phage Valary TaxID=2588130 RepID=A0A4Y5U0M3_9CAUD|nr:hypothetical protein KNU57_gp67 [Gordonia phage Valary]QDB74935.1 hypothetical protein SEA_VALARY_67 [Gordonia phage Valary]